MGCARVGPQGAAVEARCRDLWLHREASGPVQLAPCRVLARAGRRRLRPTLLHLDAQPGTGRRAERHHRHQARRHLRFDKGRQGQMVEAGARGGRGEHRTGRRRLLADTRRQDHVPHRLQDRPPVSALCPGGHLEAQRRLVGQGPGADHHPRHALALCPSCRLARWHVALLRERHARWYGRPRHLACAADHHRHRCAREPGCPRQHAGRRDVPHLPSQRRPLLLKQRPSRHGWPRHLHCTTHCGN